VFGLLAGLARRPSEAPSDWLVATGLALVAIVLVAFWRRVSLGFAAVGASSALLAAVLTGGHGALDGAGGLECLLTVGGVAALSSSAAWVVMRREPGTLPGSAMGTWAVAGALASVAALQVSCGTRSSLAHLLTFHVGGVLAVTSAAYFGARRRLETARR
jgi:hypothetical protein